MAKTPTGFRTAPAILLFSAALATTANASPQVGQIDNFQDGTTQGWGGGTIPENIPNGGPLGVGDAFLRITSNGNSTGPGSHVATPNSVQWQGDYLAAGITAVKVDFANLSVNALNMRMVLFGFNGARYTSTNAFALPADGQWYTTTYNIDAASLTRVAGPVGLDAVLEGVFQIMFRHDAGTPSSGGTTILGVLGVDNVVALPAPSSGLLLALGGLALARRRR